MNSITAKGFNPTPAISSGRLYFGIGNSSSGAAQIQAMFTNSPVNLTSNSDYITMVIVFTNVAGLLYAGEGFLGVGLYNSGASTNYPVPSGLNGTETSGNTGNALNNAQLWQGYFAQIAYSGSTSAIETRPSKPPARRTIPTRSRDDRQQF